MLRIYGVVPYSQPGPFIPILLHAGQVITRLVTERSADVDPKPTLSLVPQASLQEFWLPLHAFHLGESAKNGCQGLIGWLSFVLYHHNVLRQDYVLKHWSYTPADWPQNEQCRAHFGEFLRGYKPSLESVETRFPFSDATRVVKPFSVCFNDGFTKVLLMTAILVFIYELAAKCNLQINVWSKLCLIVYLRFYHGFQVLTKETQCFK